ncbi:hypothetical protein BDN72DRAFT_831175 [Pluteus cervinus]|uniref:Uncharacterized protein n=1 Tax=Pluteus cervinus TaxID=181527 RepID=A0ACD3BHU3_9AGAR|nr:hypothetical protein BDN72DRAFT_831175 [Pluteus cervinus]
MDSHDTDVLVALVLSLADSAQDHSQEEVLNALVQSNGDVNEAVRLLHRPHSKKRPQPTGTSTISSWLSSRTKRRKEDDVPAPTTNGSSEQPHQESTAAQVLDALPQSTSRTAGDKPTVDLMTVLRQPQPSNKPKRNLPPLLLTTPSLVKEHTPCTLHLSVLPPELACDLFYTMLDASSSWQRNKWWLFDRVVESPHRTSFYARNLSAEDDGWEEAAQYWYNGRQTSKPDVFPPKMEEACSIIEKIVNAELRKRERFPLEWAGDPNDELPWRANVAASNCYAGSKESVGFHSDQLTYLGPYPTIASLSLGTRRTFTLREVIPSEEADSRKAQTFHIPLPHNSLAIMHASCQEKFKHSIPPQQAIDIYRPQFPRPGQEQVSTSNCRINITFRFYRPDFRPSKTPRCKCDVPTILRPDMKNRMNGKTDRYWWTCYAGAQNDGNGCNFWRVMDMKLEERGPCIGDQRVNPLVEA